MMGKGKEEKECGAGREKKWDEVRGWGKCTKRKNVMVGMTENVEKEEWDTSQGTRIKTVLRKNGTRG